MRILKLTVVILAAALCGFASIAYAARTDNTWQERAGHLETTFTGGIDILINGTNKYLNFGSFSGSGGYGIRDSAGTMQFKNSGGSWTAIGSGSGGGSSFGQSWEINAAGYLAPTTTITALLPGGFVSQASSSIAALHLGTPLEVASGGMGSSTLTGILKGNGTSAVQSAVGGTDFEFPLTFTYPLQRSANTISEAWGTTTNNTWSGTNLYNATTTHRGVALTPTGNTSASVSVGGAFTLTNTSNDGAGAVFFTNHASGATGRLAIFNCNSSTFDQNCVHIQSNGTASALNLSAAPAGLGAFKWAASGTGDANSSGVSLDASTNSFLGQALFIKCGSATNCYTVTDSSSGTIFRLTGAGNFGIATGTPGSLLAIGNVANFTTATSTFYSTGGIDLRGGGCFAVNGTCISGSGGSGITAIGPAGQTQTGSTITLATSSTPYNGLTASTTITGSGNTITFTNTLAGVLGVPGGGTGSTTLTGLLIGNGTSAINTYGGSTCTNQFVRALSSSGVATCATIVAADVSLANLTATDAALTFSGTYNGNVARTIGLNLGNPNIWTAGTTTFTKGLAVEYSTTTSATTTNQRVSGQLSIASLSGFLKAVAGSVATALINLASDVTGILPVANGGTNASSLSSGFLSSGSVLSQIEHRSFTYATSTAWAGTTTIPFEVGYGELFQTVACFTDAGTLGVDFYHASSHLNYLNASTTANTNTFTTNNTITAGDKTYVDLGTPASSPTKITCTVTDKY